MPKAVIIGAGIAGIATSIRLAKKGYEVTVLEKNDYLGGKLTQVTTKGFRFDAGPSLLTMPQLIEELFQLCGYDDPIPFEYHPLKTTCKYFFSDGTEFNAHSDRQLLYQEFESKLGVSKRIIKKYLSKIKYIWGVTSPIFLYKSLHRFKTYFTLKTLFRALQLPFIAIGTTMHQFNHKKLMNKNAEQYFDRFATYNGSNPYKAPATLNVIAYLEHFEGAYYPSKGMISITESLVKLAKDMGVQFMLETQCDEIFIEEQMAKYVRTNRGNIYADLIISNADIYQTYQKLLPKHPFPEKIKQQERSSSAFIFYWGLDTEFPNLDVHNIFFSSNYQQEFKAIWDDKKIPEEPTVYINITSKYKPEDAPLGCENWFVMINVPSDSNIDWIAKKDKIREIVINLINQRLQTDITKHILVEETLSPDDIEAKTGSYRGSIYGSASNSKLAAFFRQSNQLKIANNLYAVGGSVHPGGGIPLCLLSAKITAAIIPDL